MTQKRVNEILLRIIHRKTRGKRPHYAFNLPLIAKNIGADPNQVHDATRELMRLGYIRRVDRDGNDIEIYHGRSNCTARVVKLLLDNDCLMPWDKKTRARVCRELGVKMDTLKRAVYNLGDLVNVEYTKQRHPTCIYLMDDEEARQWLADKPTSVHSEDGKCYYKYLKGYSRRKPKPEPVKPANGPKWTTTHAILDLLVKNGGRYLVRTKDLMAQLGVTANVYQYHCRKLEAASIIRRSPGALHLTDPDAAASFLAPFAHIDAQETPNTRPIPPIRPPSRCRYTKVQKTVDVPSTAFFSPSIPQTSKAAMKLIINLALRKSLEWQLSRMLLYYPKHYEAGQVKIVSTRDAIKRIDEEQDEAYRLAQGRMYARQKGIALRLLTCLQQYLKLDGAIVDPLLAETVRRCRGTLPTVEVPECDTAESVCDMLDEVLPVDSQHTIWVKCFLRDSGATTLSEFVCRGGLDLLFVIHAWNRAEPGFVDQRLAWDICLFLAYIKAHKFTERFAEQFPSALDFDGAQPYKAPVSGVVMAEAMRVYLGFTDYKVASLHSISWRIVSALCSLYPVSPEGHIEYVTAWQEHGEELAEADETGVLEQWVAAYLIEQDKGDEPRIMTYTLPWFEAKLRSVREYGLPGDVEAMNQKVSALKRWTQAEFEEQKDRLVPILNKPCRYAEPMLTWEAWDELIRTKSGTTE